MAERRLFEDLERLEAEMHRFLQEAISATNWVPFRRGRTWRPPTDVYETDSYLIVKVEIAGMSEEDFDVSLVGRTLTISGVRYDPAAKLTYHQMEVLYGEFRTEVYLPCPVVEDEIEARYEDGFLIITLPKVQVKKVPILIP